MRMAEVTAGYLELKEAEAAKWLTKEQLESVAWLPADITLIDKIRDHIGIDLQSGASCRNMVWGPEKRTVIAISHRVSVEDENLYNNHNIYMQK